MHSQRRRAQKHAKEGAEARLGLSGRGLRSADRKVLGARRKAVRASAAAFERYLHG